MTDKLSYEELEKKVEYLEMKANLVDTLQNKVNSDKLFLQKMLDTMPNPVFYKDIHGVYQNCNDSFSKTILGIPKEEIIGKSLFDLPYVIPPELAKLYHIKDQVLFDNPGTQVYEGKVKCADVRTRTFLFNKATVVDESNKVLGIVGIMLDITELKENEIKLDEKNKELETLSYTDPLTGVLNRRKFDELFIERIKISMRYKYILNFAIIDVDNFKLYNDSYGHYEGDNVLRSISNTINQRLLRPDDYLFRLGGEEFGLLYHTSDEHSSLQLIEKIRADVENLNIEHLNNDKFNKVTISIGIAIVNNLIDDTKYIYEKADSLLYQAKKAGRNKVFGEVI
ncbi:diguanylate cyclase [Arcobacter sp. 31_11_sub10_T18]|nr:diguanylate cyclase [Arcobacter sp. 31_11_sub10_T18]